MIDQILQLVKEQIGNNSEIAAAVPAQQQDAVNNEIASHLSEKLQGAGGVMSLLGAMDMSSITAGLAEKLSTKFGLSPAIANTIIAALPGLIQKLTDQNTNNDASGADNLLNSLPGGLGSKLGGFFN